MSKPRIHTVFFDVGGVLVNLDPVGFDAKIRSHCPAGTEKIFPSAFLRDMGKQVVAYHNGQISDHEFTRMAHQYLVEKHGYRLTHADVVRSWQEDFIPTANPQACAAVSALQVLGRNPSIISDTNSLHYGYIQKAFPDVFGRIPSSRHFLSCLLGVRKADGPQIFKIAMKRMFGTANPSARRKAGCLMIDNDAKALQTASQFGMETLLALSGMDYRESLRRFDIEI